MNEAQKTELEKWTPAELIAAMIAEDWRPTSTPGEYGHYDGYIVNLNDIMKDGREYWHQLAERQVTPPMAPPPF